VRKKLDAVFDKKQNVMVEFYTPWDPLGHIGYRDDHHRELLYVCDVSFCQDYNGCAE
jgi:hypothetical protein